MVRRDEKSRLAALRTVFTLTLLLAAAGADAGERKLIHGTNGTSFLEETLSKGLSDAESKLGRDECLRLFSDFHDAKGRTLQESLDTVGRTGASYLQWMVFFDGYGKRRCEETSTLASTSPNSRIIYLCSPQFLAKVRSQPGLASTLIIHEELHSLGLGEDPPTSKQITARVIERCGR
jgi:hypothetical protein